MIAKKKEFTAGILMMAAFIVVLVIFFMPVFNGMNGLDYLDNLYNSISKGSANYIDKMKKEAEPFNGDIVNVAVQMTSDEQAKQTAALFNQAAMVQIIDSQLKISGDLGRMLDACLKDAEHMFHNDGKALSERYGYNERQALYNWWSALKAMDKNLKEQKKFKEAKVIDTISAKAVETAYNYYGINPKSITDKLGVVIFSLVFYVVYTLWYGFSILFMFEGYGLRLEH